MESAVPSKAFVSALRRVLYPLVRLMLSQGMTFPYLAELIKGLFVEVAEQEFPIADKPSTDSRISLLSGVHRKDVRRLREAGRDSFEVKSSVVSFGAQLAAVWTGLPQYLGEDGRPIPLPRLASGGRRSFEGLVASVSKDIRSRVVLDEWLRLGVVSLDEQDRVVLSSGAFIPRKGIEEKLFYFGHNLHDHAAAAVHNVLGNGAPFMERSVHYDALAPGSVAQLRELAEHAGMQAAHTVNRESIELEARDADSAEPKQRVTFGIYFYSAPASNGSGNAGG